MKRKQGHFLIIALHSAFLGLLPTPCAGFKIAQGVERRVLLTQQFEKILNTLGEFKLCRYKVVVFASVI